MKKVILSIATMMATSSVFAQTFLNGSTTYTESFGTLGTSCLKSFTNAGYQYADGNISPSPSNNANAITITAVNPTISGLAPGLFDFYYTNSVPTCAAMRTANIGVDLSAAGSAKITVRIKSSVAGATVQFHVTSAPNAYPSATTASIGVPTSQTEKTLTTSFADYTVDFSGTQWTATTAAFKGKINMWGVLIPSNNALNNSAVYTIESISLGAISLATQNANVVNDQVSLFPNPSTKGSFNVDMTAMNNSEAASVRVMNANGLVVKEFSTNQADVEIATEGMNKGIYMVQITSGNKIATKKVVVE